MADVVKTVGTSGLRHYSTLYAWFADDYGSDGLGNDDCEGQVFNDSVYDEYLHGENTNINSLLARVADGEGHDGTAGTGARIVFTGNYAILCILAGNASNTPAVITGFEGTLVSDQTLFFYGAFSDGDNVVFTQNLMYGMKNVGSSDNICVGYHVQDDANSAILNNIGYDFNQTASGGGSNCVGINVSGTTNALIHNNTIHDVNSTNRSAYGYAGGKNRSNNIATSTDDGDFTGAPSGTDDYNLSSDATANGGNSITNEAASDVFASTTPGSIDLTLKSGSPAIDEGDDLGTTPALVNIDILGRDRDAEGDTWCIGAYQFVAAPATQTMPIISSAGIHSAISHGLIISG